MNQKEWDRMIGQELYDPFNVHDDSFQRVHAAQRKFNASDDLNDRQAFEELKRCFAQAPDDMVLLAPVYFDHGDRIRFRTSQKSASIETGYLGPMSSTTDSIGTTVAVPLRIHALMR